MASTLFHELESEIQQFYAARSVLITGATGLLGKILAEKLLRCCQNMKTIYLIMRPKKGKSPSERFEELLEKECFGPLKEKFPTFRDKIVIVVGDLAEPLCGISEEDLKMLQRDVSIVFNLAARVQFFDPLRTAVQENVLGTRHVLEICKKLPLIKAFVHVSTAFSRRDSDFTVPEEVGGCHVNPKQILDLLEILDDESLKKITPSIIKNMTTTYQFSKALAELLVDEEKGSVPTAIIRPCLVASTWKEPLKGWCDIYQGVSGLFVAAGKGFFRTAYAPPGYKILIIPADVVINCVVASAWYIATKRKEKTFVVNCTLKYEDFPTGEELLEPVLNFRNKYAISSMYRYPDFTLYKTKWIYKIHATVDHYVPAQIIDVFLFLITGKTLMMPLYRKIDSLWTIFVEEGNNPWYFRNDNYNRVKNAMSTKDQEIFFMDMTTLNWTEYIEDSVRGGRQFLCREDPATIPYALKKSKIWFAVTTTLKWCLILFIIYSLIPQSFMNSASMRLESYLHASKPVLDIDSDEINFSHGPDTYGGPLAPVHTL